MSKPTFSRRAPDNITEELVAVLSSKASFEFKGLFDVIFLNLLERNAASGGEEMLRLRTYEKLQSLVSQGAVTRTVTDRKSTRLNSSHSQISYAVFCLQK